MELLFFGRARQRCHAGLAALNGGSDFIEVAGANFLLMRNKGVAPVPGCEFGFLHLLDVSRHATLDVVLAQIVHVVPHGVNTRERDELVFVAHRTEFALELSYCCVIQIFLPIE